MKFFLTLLLQAISFLTITSQSINGTWQGDWQNTAVVGCQPTSLVIVGNSTSGYNISYSFANNNMTLCQEYGLRGDYSSPLTLTLNTTDTWTDNDTQKLVYDATNQVLSGYFSYAVESPLLFNLNGSSIIEQHAFGSLGGVWITNSEDTISCCAPGLIYLTYSPTNSTGQKILGLEATYYYNASSTCPGNGTKTQFEILTPNPQSLNFTSVKGTGTGSGSTQIYYTPSTETTEIVLWLNSTCSLFYEKSSVTLIKNTTWHRDWQSTSSPSISSYQVSTVTYQVSTINNSYMASVINMTDNTTENSFLIENPEGEYYDSILLNGENMTYDPTTNTLLGDNGLFLSPNGSLFDTAPFYGSWQDPQDPTGVPLGTNCCYPIMINISADSNQPNTLNAYYWMPNGFYYNPVCQNITALTHTNLTSQLYIAEPSATQLVWTDKTYGHQLLFGTPEETYVIQVTNFGGNCTFLMIAAETIPAPPLTAMPVLKGSILMTFVLFIVSILVV